MSGSSMTPTRGSEAFDLVIDMRSNLSGSLARASYAMGPTVAVGQKRDAIDAIQRTFSNPQAAAYLSAHGKNADQMISAVESNDLAGALRGVPNPAPSAPSQAQRDAARSLVRVQVNAPANDRAHRQQQDVQRSRSAL